MSKVGRTTFLVIAGMLVVFVLAVWAMLDSIDRRFRPPCLDTVPEAPDGAFADMTFELLEDETGYDIRYDDGSVMRIFGPSPDAFVEPKDYRIASTLPGITEMLAYLGAADRLVAVSPWCDVPADAPDPRKVTVQPFDAEGFLAARPNLVIVDRRLHLRDLAEIRRRVPNVLMLETSRSLPHLESSMHLLAQVLQPFGAREVPAESPRGRARAFSARYDAVLAAIDPVWEDGPPRVFLLAGWDPLYAMGPGSLLDDMLRICGASNIACDLGTDASGTFSEELVLARRPAWILATTSAPMPDRMQQRWSQVPAIQQGRVAPAHVDDVVRGGPRILDALERLNAVLRGTQPPEHLGAMK